MIVIKKSLVLFFMIVVLSTFALANKIEISTTEESFPAGAQITFKVSLYDETNNPIDANVNIIIEDAAKKKKIEQTIQADKFVDINLGENAPAGFWTITARYQETESKKIISVETNELAEFEIQGDKLTVTNIGNTRYTKTIQIIIGETLGTKTLDLNIGESENFRLIAPDGDYNVRVTDGTTIITKAGVALTGNVIGILDERITTGSSHVTGGIKPEQDLDEGFYTTLKNRNYIYVFLLVVIGAGILLAIERNYRKKV